jgi:adenine phosphoribosyltransferase
MQLADIVRSRIRDVPDFPRPGILFRDITPLMNDPLLRAEIVSELAAHFKGHHLTAVAGIEARGFIFGALLAQRLSLPFVPVRKAGKLPYATFTRQYALEYGTASLQLHVDALRQGDRVLIHDDLLATGGTAVAAAELAEMAGAEVAGFSFLVNLAFLPGVKTLVSRFGLQPRFVVEYG